MPSDAGASDPGSVPASERRVRALIESLLEAEGISEQARETLQRLKSSNREFSSAEVEDLMELLQEAVS